MNRWIWYKYAILGKLVPKTQPRPVRRVGLFAFAGLRTTYTGLVPLGAAPAPHHMNPETTPEQDKPEPFALDLNDDTPLPVICELSEDGTCEAFQ